jgi:hypothetical protein
MSELFFFRDDYKQLDFPYESVEKTFISTSHLSLLEYVKYVSLGNYVCRHFKSNKGAALTACLHNVSNLFYVDKLLLTNQRDQANFFSALFQFLGEFDDSKERQLRVLYNLILNNLNFHTLGSLLNVENFVSVNIQGKTTLMFLPSIVTTFETGFNSVVGANSVTANAKGFCEFEFESVNLKKNKLTLKNADAAQKFNFLDDCCVNVSFYVNKNVKCLYGRVDTQSESKIIIQLESNCQQEKFDPTAIYTVCVNSVQFELSPSQEQYFDNAFGFELFADEELYNYPVAQPINWDESQPKDMTLKVEFCDVYKMNSVTLKCKNKHRRPSILDACVITAEIDKKTYKKFGVLHITSHEIKLVCFNVENEGLTIKNVAVLPPLIFTTPLKSNHVSQPFFKKYNLNSISEKSQFGFFSDDKSLQVWSKKVQYFEETNPEQANCENDKFVSLNYLREITNANRNGLLNFVHLFFNSTKKIFFTDDSKKIHCLNVDCDLKIDVVHGLLIDTQVKNSVTDKLFLESATENQFFSIYKPAEHSSLFECFTDDNSYQDHVNYLKIIRSAYVTFAEILNAYINNPVTAPISLDSSVTDLGSYTIQTKINIISLDKYVCGVLLQTSYEIQMNNELSLTKIISPWFQSTTDLIVKSRSIDFKWEAPFSQDQETNASDIKILFWVDEQTGSEAMYLSTKLRIKKITLKCLCKTSNQNIFSWKTSKEIEKDKKTQFVSILDNNESALQKYTVDDNIISYETVYPIEADLNDLNQSTREKTNSYDNLCVYRNFYVQSDSIETIYLTQSQLHRFVEDCNSRQHLIVSVTDLETKTLVPLVTKCYKFKTNEKKNFAQAILNDIYSTENSSSSVLPFNPYCKKSAAVVDGVLTNLQERLQKNEKWKTLNIFFQVPTQYMDSIIATTVNLGNKFDVESHTLTQRKPDKHMYKVYNTKDRRNIDVFYGFIQHNALVKINGISQLLPEKHLGIQTSTVDDSNHIPITINKKTFFCEKATPFDLNKCFADFVYVKPSICVVIHPVSKLLSKSKKLFQEYIFTLDDTIIGSDIIEYLFKEFQSSDVNKIATDGELQIDINARQLYSYFFTPKNTYGSKIIKSNFASKLCNVNSSGPLQFNFNLRKEFTICCNIFKGIFNSAELSMCINSTNLNVICTEMKKQKINFVRLVARSGIKLQCLNESELIQLCNDCGGSITLLLAPYSILIKCVMFETKCIIGVCQATMFIDVNNDRIVKHKHYAINYAHIKFKATKIEIGEPTSFVLSNTQTILQTQTPLDIKTDTIVCPCLIKRIQKDNFILGRWPEIPESENILFESTKINLSSFYGEWIKEIDNPSESKIVYGNFHAGDEIYWNTVAYFIAINNTSFFNRSVEEWPTIINEAFLKYLLRNKRIGCWYLKTKDGRILGILLKTDSSTLLENYEEIYCVPNYYSKTQLYYTTEPSEIEHFKSNTAPWPTRDAITDLQKVKLT